MDDLIEQIDAFLAKHEMSEWQFGELVVNDRHFVRQVKAGRDLRMSTLSKVRDFMARYVAPSSSEAA